MISIVIPAYNEESVIERCLRTLTERPVGGGIEIIVACNGCHDRTAEIARSVGRPVQVVETETASKIAALNLGDRAATGYPRIYLDADVVVTLDTVERVAQVLQTEQPLAAAPRMQVDTSQSGFLVRAFYAIWLRQPYHRQGLLGGGFYGVSKAGRERFGEFPSIIADDEFVRRHFADDERINPEGCVFTIHAPRTFPDLIRVKSRSRLGLMEVRRRFPDLSGGSASKSAGVWFDIVKNPRLWPAACVYLVVNAATRLRARRQWRTIEHYRWERDESSRSEPATQIVKQREATQ